MLPKHSWKHMLTLKQKKKKRPKVHEKRQQRGCSSNSMLSFHKPRAERTQAGISRGGGEGEMLHGAVMPTDRALNVFNIT